MWNYKPSISIVPSSWFEWLWNDSAVLSNAISRLEGIRVLFGSFQLHVRIINCRFNFSVHLNKISRRASPKSSCSDQIRLSRIVWRNQTNTCNTILIIGFIFHMPMWSSIGENKDINRPRANVNTLSRLKGKGSQFCCMLYNCILHDCY